MVSTEPPHAPSGTAKANHIQPVFPWQGKEEVESGRSAYEYRKNK
jgi:hypothetical protein